MRFLLCRAASHAKRYGKGYVNPGNFAKEKRKWRCARLPSLRRYEPDQVLRDFHGKPDGI